MEDMDKKLQDRIDNAVNRVLLFAQSIGYDERFCAQCYCAALITAFEQISDMFECGQVVPEIQIRAVAVTEEEMRMLLSPTKGSA